MRASAKSVVMYGLVKAEPSDFGCGRFEIEPSWDTRRVSRSIPLLNFIFSSEVFSFQLLSWLVKLSSNIKNLGQLLLSHH